jgi:pyridoxal/pyridoxine/pyridoxamine kinase
MRIAKIIDNIDQTILAKNMMLDSIAYHVDGTGDVTSAVMSTFLRDNIDELLSIKNDLQVFENQLVNHYDDKGMSTKEVDKIVSSLYKG